MIKERRLIGLKASLFGDQTRYNPRTAELNKQRQTAVHQEAVKNVGNIENANAQRYTGIDANGNPVYEKRYNPGSYDPAPLNNVRSIYNNPGATSSYNPATGQNNQSFKQPSVQYTPPTARRQTTQEQQQSNQIFSQTQEQRLQAAGIDQGRISAYDFLKDRRIDGTINGNVYFSNVSPEFLQQLQDSGLVQSTSENADGGINVLLSLSEDQYKNDLETYNRIRSDADLQEVKGQQSEYDRAIQEQISGSEMGQDIRYGGPSAQQGQPDQSQIQESRSGAVVSLMQQGVSDPYQIMDYLNFDEQGNQVGDFTIEEVQQIMQSSIQRPGSSLPSYQTDVSQFIESYGGLNNSLREMGYMREDAMKFLQLDEIESRLNYQQGTVDAKERRERQLEFGEELTDLQRSREVAAHEKELSITQLDNDRAEALAREQAEEDEMVSRRTAARLGITTDSGGVKWMRDIVRKSNEHLSYLIKRGGMEEAGLVREHENNMKAIDYDAQVRYDKAWDDYDASVASLKKERNLDKKTIRDERKRLDENYMTKVWEADKWKADNYLAEIRRSEDRSFETWKIKDGQKFEKSLNDAKIASDAAIANRKMVSDAYESAGDVYQNITNSQTYKDYVESKNSAASAQIAWDRLNNARSKSTDPKDYSEEQGAAELAIVTAFSKLIDPGSVVREGEAKRVLESGGLWNAWKTQGLQAFFGAGGQLTIDQMNVLMDHVDELESYQRNTMQEQIAPLVSSLSRWSRDTGVSMDELMAIGVPDGVIGNYNDVADANNQYTGAPQYNINDFNESDLPPVNSYVDTAVGSGYITGYGSAASGAGLDLAAQPGTPLHVPMSGVIEEVTFNPGWKGDPFSDANDFSTNKSSKSKKYETQRSQNGGYGNSVVVRLDNGMRIRMSHLSYTVDPTKKGQRIEYGEEIGQVGNTGITYGKTGSHVDIEMEDENGKKLSPQQVAVFIGASKNAPTLAAGGGSVDTEPDSEQGTSIGSVPDSEKKIASDIVAILQNPNAFASGMTVNQFYQAQGKLSKGTLRYLGNALSKALVVPAQGVSAGVQSARQRTRAFSSGFQPS